MYSFLFYLLIIYSSILFKWSLLFHNQGVHKSLFDMYGKHVGLWQVIQSFVCVLLIDPFVYLIQSIVCLFEHKSFFFISSLWIYLNP